MVLSVVLSQQSALSANSVNGMKSLDKSKESGNYRDSANFVFATKAQTTEVLKPKTKAA